MCLFVYVEHWKKMAAKSLEISDGQETEVRDWEVTPGLNIVTQLSLPAPGKLEKPMANKKSQ